MTRPPDLISTVGLIVDRLKEAEVQFHLTGGLAASFYGEPRLTQDVDIVLKLREGHDSEKLLCILARDYIVDAEAVREGIRRQRMFQALDPQAFIKIDFHVGEDVPGELQRSRLEELFPGIVVPLVSKEDAILSKLLWIRKGSHKSRRDVVMMLRRPGNLDLEYIRQEAERLNVADLWKELSQSQQQPEIE